jgi:RNA polymerase sigma-70 factor (ECF subfamily)
MDLSASNLRLSRIDTLWTVVCGANRAEGDVSAAQRGLLDRYGGAARRYLLAATRDPDAADELFQDFAVRFLRGGLRGADPNRGRFRDYLKTVLIHLVADYHGKRRKQPASLPADHPEPAAAMTNEAEEAFRASWRDELLARSWTALEAAEKESGRPYFTVLRYRADHPDVSSQAMAEGVSRQLGKTVTAPGVRQTLHRARERFADLLLDEIAQALDRPTPEALEGELVDLGLLEHCRPALARRQGGGA